MQSAKKAAKAAAATQVVPLVPLAPLVKWVMAASSLLFLVMVELIMAFYQKPATMEEATKLSLANAQAQLRCDISEDELAISAALTITRRLADHRLVYPMLAEVTKSCVIFFPPNAQLVGFWTGIEILVRQSPFGE